MKKISKKKILFISQYFYPETFRGNDIAFYLAKEGHEVHVITGIPNYPIGKFFHNYGLFKNRKEIINNVKVTRLPIIPRGKNKIMLILNYMSFFIVGCIYVFWHALFYKYDFVFCQQLSPVMMSAPAILYKKLKNVPLYTWVLDLWPDSLTAAAGINNKIILSFFKWFVKEEYKWSDKILISSSSFKESINNYGNYNNKIEYYPQWSEEINYTLTQTIKNNIPKIPNGFIVMFAGAIGEAHGFECIMKSTILTQKYDNIKWIIIGDGRKLQWVKQFIKKNNLYNTVLTLGRYPQEFMPLFYEKADVLLVSLKDSSLFNLYAPAKISSYMASGRPIIACLNGEGSVIVKEANCGWNINAGNADDLANLVIKLSQMDKSILNEKGANGLKYYNNNFKKSTCLKKLNTILDLN